ncbi:ribonuclease R [Mesomycoplasma moatsii]|uniref:ribonuclease R n=1 Tax=Mesomycoplasma moatsii TaxID=171287 RepID=UPI0003B54AB8
MFSKNEVIDYLLKTKRSSFLNIVKFLKIKAKDNQNFSKFLNELKNNGEIAYSRKNDDYFVPKLIGNFNSTLKINLKGSKFCFVNLENKEIKVLVFNDKLNLLKDDEININVYKDLDDDFYFGIPISVIKRKNEIIYAEIDENLELKPIYFSQNFIFKYDKSLLKPRTFAKFKIEKYTKDILFLKLIKILSSIDKPYADIDLIVDYSNIEKDFNNLIIEETNKIPDEVENVNDFNRVDLTNQLIVTIDGEKTKDFDDAISVEKTSNNTYILGVHIADVAYYVKENSQIDLEARNRGTSIYLIDRVIPMLPEKLSNGICSLNPNVRRFTISVIAEIDVNGKILSKKLFPSMIESKYRLTYNQVANLDQNEIIKNNSKLYKMLIEAYELSEIIGKNKTAEGYIDFEIEEPIIELDKVTGKAIAIKSKERLSSEILIENFMVFANEVVSKMISDLKIPSIYRVHEAPDHEKIENLKSFIKILGIHDIRINQSDDPKVFQNMVNSLKKQRFDNLIKMALLRTMQKAKYSSYNIGHFGLASKYYSHFTSPIRRYPDLLLHRIIWEVLFKKNKKYSIDKESQIESIANNSSKLEIRAIDLERKVNDIKKAEFYSTLINQVKEAIIVSIQKFGMFIEFDDSTNSLVHISTIVADYKDYEISNDLCQLILKNKIYKIGQKVKAKILSVNKLEGKIDSIIID